MTNPNSLPATTTPKATVSVDLSRHDFMLVREGGRDLRAWKKSMDKARKLSAALPTEKGFNSVKEVRRHRAGAVD